MKYWLDLFTGSTWDEFRSAGSRITGFRKTQQGQAKRVLPGDIFLCYLTGVKRWIGALEIVGPTPDVSPIWKDADFPVRFEVNALVMLDPSHGIPMDDLMGRVSFYPDASYRGKYRGLVRRSPNLIREADDGRLIMELMRQAEHDPIARPVDAKLLARRPRYSAVVQRGKAEVPTVVSVPEADPPQVIAPAGEGQDFEPVGPTTRHTEIQYHLLTLGAEMGLDVWVAKNDRSRVWDGQCLGNLPRLVSRLPTQFNDATRKTIELIDVLWLKGNTFVAAFEVECTTSIYSGLLRMSDLIALQPNLDMPLYLVAPDERRAKVEDEILRPTFKLRDRPLGDICGFLSFSALMEKVEGIRRLGLASSLKPEFLEQTAEFFRGESGA